MLHSIRTFEEIIKCLKLSFITILYNSLHFAINGSNSTPLQIGQDLSRSLYSAKHCLDFFFFVLLHKLYWNFFRVTYPQATSPATPFKTPQQGFKNDQQVRGGGSYLFVSQDISSKKRRRMIKVHVYHITTWKMIVQFYEIVASTKSWFALCFINYSIYSPQPFQPGHIDAAGIAVRPEERRLGRVKGEMLVGYLRLHFGSKKDWASRKILENYWYFHGLFRTKVKLFLKCCFCMINESILFDILYMIWIFVGNHGNIFQILMGNFLLQLPSPQGKVHHWVPQQPNWQAWPGCSR